MADSGVHCAAGAAADVAAAAAEDDDDVEAVELGFLEPLEAGARPALEAADAERWDGGKAGGRPAFLVPAGGGAPGDLPAASALTCGRFGCALLLRKLASTRNHVGDDLIFVRILPAECFELGFKSGEAIRL